MPLPIIARFQQILPHAFLHNVWGPTETTVMGTGMPATLLSTSSKQDICNHTSSLNFTQRMHAGRLLRYRRHLPAGAAPAVPPEEQNVWYQ